MDRKEVALPARDCRQTIAQKLKAGLAVSSLLVAGIASAVSKPGASADAFIARQMISPKQSGYCSVIARLNGRLTKAQEKQLRSLGGGIYRHLDLVKSVALTIPTRNLKRLASLDFVDHLSSDETIKKCDEFTVGRSGADVAFSQYGLTGSGVTVAVLDSGIGSNSDLDDAKTGKSRVLASVNFVPGTKSTDDGCGHGTHVAGIIAGNGSASSTKDSFRTFYGIARHTNLLNVRVLDGLGSTSVSAVVSALQWVVSNKAKYNIRVINLSMGHPVGESYTTDPLCQAVEQAYHAGIVVVVAAGNEGRTNSLPLGSKDNEGYGTAYGSIGSPGNDPYVITVGAMKSADSNRNNDTIATYSSRGPSLNDFILKPDLVAPGNKVVSLVKPLGFCELTSLTGAVPIGSYRSKPPLLGSSNYFTLSGTSMAAPVVSGAAALMLEQDPTLTPDTVKARLMSSADKWGNPDGTFDPCTYGAGYLNIPAALQSHIVATQSARSPFLVRDTAGQVQISQDSSIWGQRALWGTGLTGLNSIWGNRALWGNNSLSSSRALWGNSIWGERALWGNSQFQIDLGIITLGGE